jgi:protein tyrosine phosphatase
MFHYYFTGWPDFSVIDRQQLLELIETIDEHGQNKGSKAKDPSSIPIVVHCR